jgi:hypothetical protein
MEDGIFLLIFWLLVGPFWIAWKLLVLVWQFIFKPLNQSLADANAKKFENRDAAQKAERQKARDDARAKQLDALRAAAPQSPPERMRATIHMNEFKIAKTEAQQVHRLIAEDSWISVEVGEDTRYAVDMLLEMSETERGIIQEHQLEDLVIEDNPAFTERDLIRSNIASDKQRDATKDILLKEVQKLSQKSGIEMMKQERVTTRLGDYLVSPFTKTFLTPHEAKQYADKLKTKILPTLRRIPFGSVPFGGISAALSGNNFRLARVTERRESQVGCLQNAEEGRAC